MGQKYSFRHLQRFEDFREEVPIFFYDDIKAQVDQLKKGARDLYWPDEISRFAVSAGTSGAGKHLPLTEDRLGADRQFMRKVLKSYLLQRPNIFRLWGKHISMPGSLEDQEGYEIGEISAFTSRQAPWWLSAFQLISAGELVRLPFNEKIDRIVNTAIHHDVRVISAVPSWILTIFQQILQKTGKKSIGEVWPNLSVIVCGGVKLDNYRTHLEKLIQNPQVDFIETYGASEGYFSYTDDLQRKDMKLVIDNGIFYEFIPNPLPNRDSLPIQQAIPLWEVDPHTPYAMVVSTNAGLWRYALNDLIQFTQTDPPRIKVMGRVSEMLDDFGEALYSYEAQSALSEASSALDIDTGPFTIAATLEHKDALPRHLWFIQITDPIHRNTLDRLAEKIDGLLRDKNRHYAIRRDSEALGKPKIYSISQQQINSWLARKGKNKAQGKLPAILTQKEDIQFFK